MKAAQSTISLGAQTTPIQQQHQKLQQCSSSGTASTVVKNVNSSRMTTTRAGARGIAEIFLADDEMAEQNVPVIKTLVAETAFTSK